MADQERGDKAQHDYPALCRSLAAWLMGESQGEHRELKRGETADRLLEMASLLSTPRTAEPARECLRALTDGRCSAPHCMCPPKGQRAELEQLREIEHRAWHVIEMAEENASTGTVVIDLGTMREDYDKLVDLLPEGHPESSVIVSAELSLTPEELQRLIDFHDNASAGAEAQDYFDAAHYHAKRGEHFRAKLARVNGQSEETLRKMVSEARPTER